MVAPLLLPILVLSALASTSISFPIDYANPDNYLPFPRPRPSNFFPGYNNDKDNNNNNYYNDYNNFNDKDNYYFDKDVFPRIFGDQFDARVPLTCANYPKMCGASWSSGPDCCRGQCVNMKTDFFNCGRCGRMCRFGQMCCEGQCVDVSFNKDHCGWCKSRCSQGATCTYGMCNYA